MTFTGNTFSSEADFKAQFSASSNIWSGNKSTDGQFVWPDGSLHADDWTPARESKAPHEEAEKNVWKQSN
jgi:hypothetical protein